MNVNEIVIGDCLSIMAGFPEESIGLIITSPPYNVGLNYDGFIDDISQEEFEEFNQKWLAEAFRISKDGARIYIAISDKMLFWFKPVAEKAGWIYSHKLVWCKPNLGGGKGRISGDWHYMTEDILLFRKGKRTPMLSSYESNCYNWIVATTPQTNFKEKKEHPAQMPLKLCRKLIVRTPGEPVLDPFAGSGSVLVAAKELGRDYVGIELVESVANKARKRLNATNPPLYPEQLEEQADLLPDIQS